MVWVGYAIEGSRKVVFLVDSSLWNEDAVSLFERSRWRYRQLNDDTTEGVGGVNRNMRWNVTDVQEWTDDGTLQDIVC